ncbi:MAG: ATPase, partial [Paludibacteraceae bacterium]|nr:ATPase [Paludibacteraceae bacterium]
MNLIADSGSTKTAWCLSCGNQIIKQFETAGINPFFQTEEEITAQLKETLLPQIVCNDVENVYFYGAGCADPVKNNALGEVLKSVIGAKTAFVASDMLGAARGLLGRERGIACILGTGANSGVYDGEALVKGVYAGGYILGDEGSGGVLGKLLISDWVKKQMPQDIYDALTEEYGLTYLGIVDRVYKQPFPNRWLAQFTKFMSARRENEYIHNLLVGAFKAFFERNIKQYEEWKELEVGFIGSIAFYFNAELREAAEMCGIKLGKVMQNPIDGLVE